jgi:hypothetical protein
MGRGLGEITWDELGGSVLDVVAVNAKEVRSIQSSFTMSYDGQDCADEVGGSLATTWTDLC